MATKAPAYLDEEFAELATSATVAQLKVMVRAARPAPPTPVAVGARARTSRWRLVRRRRPVPPPRRARCRPRPHRRRRADRGPRRAVPSGPDRRHVGRGDRRDGPALARRCTRRRRERFRANWFIDPTDPVPARWTDGLAVPDWLRDQLSATAPSGRRSRPTPSPSAWGGRSTRCPNAPADRRATGSQVPGPVVHPDPLAAGPPPRPRRARGPDGHVEPHRHLSRPTTAAHHRGQLGITGNADDPNGLTFTDARGRVIDPATRRGSRPGHRPIRSSRTSTHSGSGSTAGRSCSGIRRRTPATGSSRGVSVDGCTGNRCHPRNVRP